MRRAPRSCPRRRARASSWRFESAGLSVNDHGATAARRRASGSPSWRGTAGVEHPGRRRPDGEPRRPPRDPFRARLPDRRGELGRGGAAPPARGGVRAAPPRRDDAGDERLRIGGGDPPARANGDGADPVLDGPRHRDGPRVPRLPGRRGRLPREAAPAGDGARYGPRSRRCSSSASSCSTRAGRRRSFCRSRSSPGSRRRRGRWFGWPS